MPKGKNKVRLRKENFLKQYDPTLNEEENAKKFGTTRRTIYTWKKEDWFREAIEKIKRDYDGGRVAPPPPTQFIVPDVDGTWKEKFLAAYVPCFGNMSQAAMSSGVELLDVMRATIPPGEKGHSKKHYDPQFVEGIEQLDPVVKVALEDQVRHRSVTGKGDSSSLRWVLASKYPDQYGPRAQSTPKGPAERTVPIMSDDVFDKLIAALG